MLHSLGKRASAPGDPADPVKLLLDCHARIRGFAGLAEAVGRNVDAPAEEIVDACARCERYFREAFPLHVADEEQSVLPRLAGSDSELAAALERMRAEHAAHATHVDDLVDACRAVAERPGDAERHKTLSVASAHVAAELEAHLTLEEAIVFPAIAKLAVDERQAIVRELRARRAT